ncbi:MAG: type II toxin-antitoxin system ParD family antitoxin [Pyrinomonadaceae bacterium]|nr:type II toxin-antitoxin system ParD family antitoxin [Pyrinomonadaceae bacterium]
MSATTMNVSLPASMKAYVDERVEHDEYGTASEYIRELIRNDQRRREEAKLERVLLERLQATDAREFSIDEVKHELAKRVGKRK